MNYDYIYRDPARKGIGLEREFKSLLRETSITLDAIASPLSEEDLRLAYVFQWWERQDPVWVMYNTPQVRYGEVTVFAYLLAIGHALYKCRNKTGMQHALPLLDGITIANICWLPSSATYSIIGEASRALQELSGYRIEDKDLQKVEAILINIENRVAMEVADRKISTLRKKGSR
jgi:hypothetical protein